MTFCGYQISSKYFGQPRITNQTYIIEPTFTIFIDQANILSKTILSGQTFNDRRPSGKARLLSTLKDAKVLYVLII